MMTPDRKQKRANKQALKSLDLISSTAVNIEKPDVSLDHDSVLAFQFDKIALADIIDVPALQSLMNDFYDLTHIPMAIIDMAGKVLVGVGWQEICTSFHRVNPQTCGYCIESDLELTGGINEGEFKLYKCKNNMWDAATPIIVAGHKMGNLFTGQFFFDDETPDYDLFRAQAKTYGFDPADYMSALKKVPRLSRQKVEQGMNFLHGLAKMIAQNSVVNVNLARLLEQQKQTEDALRQSEEWFHSMFDRHQAVMLVIEPESGSVHDANAAAAQFYGYSRHQLCAMRIQDINQLSPEEVAAERQQAVAEQRNYFVFPHRLANGQVRTVEVYSTPFSFRGQTLLYSIIHDITERKQAEKALQKAHDELEMRVKERTAQLHESVKNTAIERQQLFNVLETLPAYVCLLTPDYYMPFANRKFREWFGYQPNKRCYQFLFDRSEPCENCDTYTVLKTNKPQHWEWTGPNGHIYDIYDFPFKDTDGSNMILEMGIDITDRKQAQQAIEELNQTLEQRIDQRTAELRQSQQDLYKLNESLERRVVKRTQQVQQQADQLRALASQLSQAEQRERKRLSKILHDHIQQLIVAARMQLAWMRSDNDPERQSSVQAADAILNEALDASRSLAVDLSPPILHEAGLTGGLSWLAARMQKSSYFTVHLTTDNNAEPAEEETRFLLFECARELLLNVVKHAGVSEACVTLTRTKENQIQLTVADRGKGFDSGLLANRRLDETTFGLFSIRERLAHIGGQMQIESAPGSGARFILTVSCAPASDQSEQTGQTRTIENAPPSGDQAAAQRPCRVLVCDDHKIVREGLVKLLQYETGIDVVGQAQSGRQAVDIAVKLAPDVVIMDVNLGDMSGIEATQRILAANPCLKIIALSMHEDFSVAKAMHNAGAVAYLTKTGPAEDLIAAVRACHQRSGAY